MDYDAVANYVIMNQLCKVCGEPAAGFHFGAFTCEGCKSFFGRTYNNIGSISECKNNGKCVINKKNRTACKACRLRKCMMVGMSKSGSRYGRRSNWFKIHCLLQQQQQQQQHGDANLAAAANLLRPNPYLTPLFRSTPGFVNTALPVRENSGRSSESDSGASSADPEDDLRSASAMSYPSLRHLPSPSSDTECFARRKQSLSFSNNNNTAPLSSISPASLPCISPSALVPNINNNNNINARWLNNNPTFPLQGLVGGASPFAGLGIPDPAIWRELWMRQNIPAAAAVAPDQEQPIDLSLRQTSNKENSSDENDLKDMSNEIDEKDVEDIDVEIEESVSRSVPLDLTLER